MTAKEIYEKLVLPQVDSASWHQWGHFVVALNEAQTLMAALTGCLYDVAESVIIPEGTFVFQVLGVAPLFRRLRRAFTASGQLVVVNQQVIGAGGILERGTPRRIAQVGSSSLLLDPVPDSAFTLTIEYERFPRLVNAESDEPEIPRAYHASLDGYIVPRMMLLEGGNELARTAPGLKKFMKAAEQLRQEVLKRGR
jgi:hypothetical protein